MEAQARWIKYLVYLTLTTAIGTEILLRIFDPIDIEYTFEIHRIFRLMSSTSGLLMSIGLTLRKASRG